VLAPVALDGVLPLVLEELGPGGHDVVLDIPETLPEVLADAALLDRVLANLLANALRHSPRDTPPEVLAASIGGRVEIRVVDRGPGVPEADRELIFQTFQRMGDRDASTGVGLGLALSRGLTEAMGGALSADHTPGGGLTMTLVLDAAGTPSGPPSELAPGSGELPGRWEEKAQENKAEEGRAEGGQASIRSRSSRAAPSTMKSLRGATSLPMSRSNTSSAASVSPMVMRRKVRLAGSIVVSRSCEASISPRPL